MTLLRKVMAILLAATMLFAVAACGVEKDHSSDNDRDDDKTSTGNFIKIPEKVETSKQTKDNTEYVIGFSGPLTGPAAVYGQAVKNAAMMAVEEINAAGGLDGVKFKLEAMDDKHDATNVAANFTALMEGGMQVSLGTVTTAPGLEFSKLSNDDKVFFLTPSASGDEIPEYDNGFQMCFADGNQGAVAADFVNGLGYSRIGIFYKDDDSYSMEIYEQFRANLNRTIMTVEASFNDYDIDFTEQINTLKDCDFIFMPIYYQPASVFMTQAKGVIADNATYYGCDGFDGLAGQIDLATIPQKISMLSHFDSSSTDEATKTFVDKYTKKYGAETLNQFGASAYDCVYAIYGAMKELKEQGENIAVTISANKLCELLSEHFTDGYTFSGVTGNNITWTDEGYVSKAAKEYVIKGFRRY